MKKTELNDKAQNAFGSVRGVVKTMLRNANVNEEIMKTARLFANLDMTMKSTYQSLDKLSAGLSQLEERNLQIVETLHLIPKINYDLKIEEMISVPPSINNDED
ncbi:12912_t:CDS:2 [Entrophospora sp. SA101]|nr:519_t:CDS:2 [Entrophospora sp. SA101]CAJ0649818.1 12912_t:CDS:2 [Entrophospora sp. SA101]CAJ0852010.1 5292_t:CDS:2 [Entrophospora sp. SA101]CAJ0904968.1 7343_t:CDS:2 [Entrophospora sp. SA101]